MAVLGRFKRVAISIDGGATYTEIGGLVDATLNGNRAEVEKTSVDSGVLREYEPGHQDYTLDLTLRYKDDDPGQTMLQNAIDDGITAKYRLRAREASGAPEWIVDAFSTSDSLSMPLEDVDELTVTLRISAKIKQTQA